MAGVWTEGSHQLQRLLQLGQRVLGMVFLLPQFPQGVFISQVAEPRGQGAQTYEVALVFPLLLHRPHFRALSLGRQGRWGMGRGRGSAWPPHHICSLSFWVDKPTDSLIYHFLYQYQLT